MMCKCLIGTAIFGSIAIGLGLYFGLITRQDVKDAASAVKDRFTDIVDSDPFAGFGGTGTNANTTTGLTWRNANGKGGLELEIVNALDDRWASYFAEAVADWENGDPDALILTTSMAKSPDPSCAAIDGKMKVCNGDYGDTGWRGVNELVFDGKNRIQTSVAKMNEFYLDAGSSDNEKQYTMCHEIGHGFGLAHTDENFMNAPLGDCLDYTKNPEPNLRPGLVNYEKLANMYGTVGGNRNRNRLRSRQLSSSRGQGSRQMQNEGTPAWVQQSFREKQQSLVLGVAGDIHDTRNKKNLMNGWTLLHQSDFGETHHVDLGDGYYGHVTALLV